ncbi:ATP-binding protein [Muricoccus radiodurans]|uniref:ATP-binding protein n=1 Tax=Muricoccus radiodurans TaxID=2231721 RepID=UPI003CE7FB6B
MPPDPVLSLSARTGLDGLAEAQARIAAHLTALGASVPMLNRVALVVEEVVLNVGNHGHDTPGPHPVDIALAQDAEGITLLIEDRARLFNPVSAALPERPTRLEEAEPGGLGLMLVRQMADELRHDAREGGGNRLTVRLRER